jgi:hypothetical protein
MEQRPPVRHPSEIHSTDPHAPTALPTRRRVTAARFRFVRKAVLLNCRIRIQEKRKQVQQRERSIAARAAF